MRLTSDHLAAAVKEIKAALPRGITAYFVHDTLTPNNVRATWYGVTSVPAIGALVDLAGAGRKEDSYRATWRVKGQEWHDAHSVTLIMTG